MLNKRAEYAGIQRQAERQRKIIYLKESSSYVFCVILFIYFETLSYVFNYELRLIIAKIGAIEKYGAIGR